MIGNRKQTLRDQKEVAWRQMALDMEAEIQLLRQRPTEGQCEKEVWQACAWGFSGGCVFCGILYVLTHFVLYWGWK